MLWDNLHSLSTICDGNWYVLGDFNSYFGAHKKSGGRSPSSRSCNEFIAAMNDCDLFCLDTRGSLYTWTNNRVGNQCIDIRLDRAFCNNNALGFWRFVECSNLV